MSLSSNWIAYKQSKEVVVGNYHNTLLISWGRENFRLLLLQGTISVNVLGEFYQKLPMGLKDAIFGKP